MASGKTTIHQNTRNYTKSRRRISRLIRVSSWIAPLLFFFSMLVSMFTVLSGLTAMGQDRTVERSGSLVNRKVVTPGQINGTYRSHENEFRILALGHNKLKIQFNGQWMTRYHYPNLGEAIGEAAIEGNVATFVPPNTRCKITLTFLTNRVEVVQDGTDSDCGFGRNVMATGTYRRIKGGKPRFIPMTR